MTTVGDWEEYVDPKSGETFYYNHATNKSQWVRPTDFDTNNSNVEVDPDPNDGIPHVHVGHGWTTRRNLSEEVRKQGVWHEYLDKESGEPFFYNDHSGETQWEVPEGYEPLTSPTKSSVHLVDWNERRERSSPIRTLSKNNVLKDWNKEDVSHSVLSHSYAPPPPPPPPPHPPSFIAHSTLFLSKITPAYSLFFKSPPTPVITSTPYIQISPPLIIY